MHVSGTGLELTLKQFKNFTDRHKIKAGSRQERDVRKTETSQERKI